MRRVRTVTGCALALALLLAGTPPARAQSTTADVEAWTARLRADGATDEDRASAEAALRAIAAGNVDDPATREATFALAQEGSLLEERPLPGRALRDIAAATSLYPDDPRSLPLLRVLAPEQVAARDPFGAHLSYAQLLAQDADPGPATLARAANNAATVGDLKSAFTWAERLEPDALEPPLATLAHLARLKAGAGLNRFEMALESARWLEQHARESFHLDPSALLAAARAQESAGLLERAAGNYQTYVNVYSGADDQPEALLGLGRLLARAGETGRAERFLSWLVERHPRTPEAKLARLEMLELDGRPANPEQSGEYLSILRDAEQLTVLRRAADRFTARFIGAGLPLELLSALGALAREPADRSPSPMASLAAREALGRSLEAALALLASRNDDVGLVAASSEAFALDIAIPDNLAERVSTARRALGLPPFEPGALGDALAEAREEMARDEWEAAAKRLGNALVLVPHPHPDLRVEVTGTLAEALWRAGREQDSLATLDRALELLGDGPRERPLLVLRADVLFAAGRREEACRSYRGAAELEATRWVGLQLERCAGPAADGEEVTAS